MVSTLYCHDNSDSLARLKHEVKHDKSRSEYLKRMEEDARIHRMICPQKKPVGEPRFLGEPRKLNF